MGLTTLPIGPATLPTAQTLPTVSLRQVAASERLPYHETLPTSPDRYPLHAFDDQAGRSRKWPTPIQKYIDGQHWSHSGKAWIQTHIAALGISPQRGNFEDIKYRVNQSIRSKKYVATKVARLQARKDSKRSGAQAPQNVGFSSANGGMALLSINNEDENKDEPAKKEPNENTALPPPSSSSTSMSYELDEQLLATGNPAHNSDQAAPALPIQPSSQAQALMSLTSSRPMVDPLQSSLVTSNSSFGMSGSNVESVPAIATPTNTSTLPTLTPISYVISVTVDNSDVDHHQELMDDVYHSYNNCDFDHLTPMFDSYDVGDSRFNFLDLVGWLCIKSRCIAESLSTEPLSGDGADPIIKLVKQLTSQTPTHSSGLSELVKYYKANKWLRAGAKYYPFDNDRN